MNTRITGHLQENRYGSTCTHMATKLDMPASAVKATVKAGISEGRYLSPAGWVGGPIGALTRTIVWAEHWPELVK